MQNSWIVRVILKIFQLNDLNHQFEYMIYEVYNFSSGRIYGKHRGYKCINCGTILSVKIKNQNYLDAKLQNVLNKQLFIHHYDSRTCEEIIMQKVLE